MTYYIILAAFSFTAGECLTELRTLPRETPLKHFFTNIFFHLGYLLLLAIALYFWADEEASALKAVATIAGPFSLGHAFHKFRYKE